MLVQGLCRQTYHGSCDSSGFQVPSCSTSATLARLGNDDPFYKYGPLPNTVAQLHQTFERQLLTSGEFLEQVGPGRVLTPGRAC